MKIFQAHFHLCNRAPIGDLEAQRHNLGLIGDKECDIGSDSPLQLEVDENREEF